MSGSGAASVLGSKSLALFRLGSQQAVEDAAQVPHSGYFRACENS
jgi:hypothetical protein